jgi:hypothetical protein
MIDKSPDSRKRRYRAYTKPEEVVEMWYNPRQSAVEQVTNNPQLAHLILAAAIDQLNEQINGPLKQDKKAHPMLTKLHDMNPAPMINYKQKNRII